MDFLLSRYRNMTALLLVILAQLVLLAWQVKTSQDVRLIRVWSVVAVTPLARVMEFVRQNTVGVLENYILLVNVRTDNQELQNELGRVKLENQFLRNELSTADRVRALQAFQEKTPSRTLPARIIGTGTGANARVVFVDQGSTEGVMRGMAVITPDGIVGKVLAAYPTASQVLLITDPTFAAGVISQKNRVHGTVKGVGQSKVVVDYVQNEEKLEQGEMFYTSGDDRVFPKGMPVGHVTVLRSGNPFKEIYLVPSAFQQGLEEVLIVIEGVHGQIPEAQTAVATGIYLMPPVETPKPAAQGTRAQTNQPSNPAAEPGAQPALTTEADRIRERYKRLGETQGYTYGQPGRIPNFNADPAANSTQPGAVRPQAPAAGNDAAAPANSVPSAGSAVRPPAGAVQQNGQPGTQPAAGSRNPTVPMQGNPAASNGSIPPASQSSGVSGTQRPAGVPQTAPPKSPATVNQNGSVPDPQRPAGANGTAPAAQQPKSAAPKPGANQNSGANGTQRPSTTGTAATPDRPVSSPPAPRTDEQRPAPPQQ